MIEKTVSPKGKSVRVLFELPAEVAHESVKVVGDFNEWNADKGAMTFDAKTGVWTKAISLKPGNRYEFRYLVDGQEWQNDEEADGYVPNPFSGHNCVLNV